MAGDEYSLFEKNFKGNILNFILNKLNVYWAMVNEKCY